MIYFHACTHTHTHAERELHTHMLKGNLIAEGKFRHMPLPLFGTKTWATECLDDSARHLVVPAEEL